MAKIGISQNGWTVYDTTDKFVRTEVEGVGFWSANADVALVLDDFTQRFHDTIEPITLPVKEALGRDDWSWAVRPIRGQTTGYSNHGSATARDLNATRHPRGVHNTYSISKRARLRALVADYEGVLRHGEFYVSATIDGMHVEIYADSVEVKEMANKIRTARAAAEKELDVDERTLRAIVSQEAEAAVKRVLTTAKIVPNRPTNKAIAEAAAAGKPVPETTYFTTVNALANIETDQDNDRDAVKAAQEPPAPIS